MIPNHLITANVEDMPDEIKAHRDQLEGRAMLVKRARVIPLEAIVRGFLTGKTVINKSSRALINRIQDLLGKSTKRPRQFMGYSYHLGLLNLRDYHNPYSHPQQRLSKVHTTKIFTQMLPPASLELSSMVSFQRLLLNFTSSPQHMPKEEV